MKKLLLLLIYVSLMFSCVSIDKNNEDNTKEKILKRYHIDEIDSPNDTLTYLKKDMSLVNGIVFRSYENGKLKDETNYKEGKRDGLYKWWYENDQLKVKGEFINNEFNGLWTKYHKNGKISGTIPMIDGESIGEKERCWDEEGKEIYCNPELKTEYDY